MATLSTQLFELYLPPRQTGGGLDQDEEWCEVELEGERRRIRFHDYAAIYNVPGLYEHLFAELLECSSPGVVCDLLGNELDDTGVDAVTLRALDFGAGNGMVAEELAELGVDRIVGIDLLPEARDAALRDRPGVYDDYLAVDVTDLGRGDRALLESHGFGLLTCVAALGFGDIPPAAFAEAFNLVSAPGWIAFNLRERFLQDSDPAGFGAFIGRMLDEGVLEERARMSYTHRLSCAGEPLTYLALVARKRRDVPLDWTR
jgi:SAM-dependent methyltransferase